MASALLSRCLTIAGFLVVCLTAPLGALAYIDPCQAIGVGCSSSSVRHFSSASNVPAGAVQPVIPPSWDAAAAPTYPVTITAVSSAAPKSAAPGVPGATLDEPLHAGADLAPTGPASGLALIAIAAAGGVLFFVSFLSKRHA